MRKKWLFTAVMIAIAAIAVSSAVWSYKGINEKMNLENERQNTMSLTEVDQEGDTSEEKPIENVQNDKSSGEEEQDQGEQEVGAEESNPELPVLKLKSERVEIKIGDSFDQLSQIETITDNKDTQEMLYRTIWIHGIYDIYVPGEYPIQYVVTDSDGNQSLPQILTLVVKE